MGSLEISWKYAKRESDDCIRGGAQEIILEMIPMTDGVEELMDVLEPFYEMEEDADHSVEENKRNIQISGVTTAIYVTKVPRLGALSSATNSGASVGELVQIAQRSAKELHDISSCCLGQYKGEHLADESDGEVSCDSVERSELPNQPLQWTMDTKPQVSATEMNMLEDEAGQEDVQGLKGVQLKGSRLFSLGSLSHWDTGDDCEHCGKDGRTRCCLDRRVGAALIRLQEDVRSAVQRLHALDALTVPREPS
ncbi:uncharacterized protein [Paramormyrops kingsleyae]|uniref:uncharacterized protein n=1 Tax=Paramormyrops kingsleyae TaxID=1676925 RepID=UPI003B97BB3F